MKKILIILIVGLILVSGCGTKETQYKDNFLNEPVTISRTKQAEIFLKYLNNDYKSEEKAFQYAANLTLNRLSNSCVEEANSVKRDLCFDNVYKLINKGEIWNSELLDVWSEGTTELLYKGQHTEVDLFELYQELSRKISEKEREIREKLNTEYDILKDY